MRDASLLRLIVFGELGRRCRIINAEVHNSRYTAAGFLSIVVAVQWGMGEWKFSERPLGEKIRDVKIGMELLEDEIFSEASRGNFANNFVYFSFYIWTRNCVIYNLLGKRIVGIEIGEDEF